MPGRAPLTGPDPNRRSTEAPLDDAPETPAGTGPRAGLIATLVAVPVAAVVAVVLFLVADRSTSNPRAHPTTQPAIPTGSPVTVAPVPRNAAADHACPSMLAALPGRLAGQPRRPVKGVESEYAVAWGQPPLILQCGVPRPAGYTRTAQVVTVAHVTWFTPTDVSPTGPTGTWTVVDRSVYVRVIVPAAYPTDTVLTAVAAAVRRTMPPRS